MHSCVARREVRGRDEEQSDWTDESDRENVVRESESESERNSDSDGGRDQDREEESRKQEQTHVCECEGEGGERERKYETKKNEKMMAMWRLDGYSRWIFSSMHWYLEFIACLPSKERLNRFLGMRSTLKRCNANSTLVDPMRTKRRSEATHDHTIDWL